MSDKVNETKYIKAQVPVEQRCVFTTTHGNRCRNPHHGNAVGLCIIHEGKLQKADDADVKAVAEQLLANDVELRTRDDVNRFTFQLLTLVAEKRISRQDGSLLAYIASVLLQTVQPVRRKKIVEEPQEYAESPAIRIRDESKEMLQNMVARLRESREPQMPGRSDNPYTYPSNYLKR
jgi:hypothetical protein